MTVMLPHPRRIPPSHGKNLPVNLRKIMDKLREADRDNNGSYNKSELKHALKDLGAYFPGWRADRAFGKIDVNNDGQISGEEIDSLLEYLGSCGFGK
ncbi:hypothetical protein ACSQ67_000194 [Phaseolus vulgaris]